MSTTTYSVGHSVARRLRSTSRVQMSPGWWASVVRLERGEGTEDDVKSWLHYSAAQGHEDLVELFASMLTPLGGER